MEQKKLKPLKEKICISVDPEIVNRIRDLADADDRSFSSYVNKILREHIIKVDKTVRND